MAQIYDSIKALLTQDRMTKAAETLGENVNKVSDASKVILPSLLAMMLKKGNTPQIKEVVDMAGTQRDVNYLTDIFNGHGVVDGVNLGERMENAILGSDNTSFVNAVSSHTKLDAEKTDRFTNWIAATVATYLGDKVAGGTSLNALFADLGKEKDALARDIPAGIIPKLGLNSVLGNVNEKKSEPKPAPAPKKKNNWLWWLLAIILLLLIILWWRSCDNKKKAERAMTVTEQPAPVATPVATPKPDRQATQVTLPDGTVINVYTKGAEDRMVQYLKSDSYKNAKLDDLKKNWFVFDDVEFKHDSASEFMNGSQSSNQLDNIVKIMKNYPDAKIMIAGNADKTGGKAVNMEISKERAEFIKSYMVKGGIAATRISTEGFGKEYAQHPADAPDSQRAADRELALRFNK